MAKLHCLNMLDELDARIDALGKTIELWGETGASEIAIDTLMTEFNVLVTQRNTFAECLDKCKLDDCERPRRKND